MSTLNLPDALAPFRQIFEQSVAPYVRIRVASQASTALNASHIGGPLRLPPGMAYPTDDQGRWLLLLAQINFAEVPALADFPEAGLLQFYVAGNASYGFDAARPTEQINFRVLYFPDAEDGQEAEYDRAAGQHTPLLQPGTLEFSPASAPVAPQDLQFEALFGKSPYAFFEPYDPAVKKTYQQLAEAAGHKLGGYAHFTQEDPRWMYPGYEKAVLLLQLDSDGQHLQWGDRGIAHWFILPDDLRRRDFSRVLYHWETP